MISKEDKVVETKSYDEYMEKARRKVDNLWGKEI